MEARAVVLYNTAYTQLCGIGSGALTYSNAQDAKKILFFQEFPMDMIKVSANSRTSAVAGAIAGVVREHHRAEVQAIGAGAVNQAMKALILATGYLRNDGIHVSCVPEFADVTIEDKVRTAIKLVIEPSTDSDFSSIRFPVTALRSEDARV
jgi:stage V sporulation protein S